MEERQDIISRQAAIDAILAVTGNSSVRELYEHVQEHGLSEMWSGGVSAAIDVIIAVPSAQPERRCVNCGRTVNNGGWYEDGRTRCPIEEHYALPKDGYCHLWEKRNVTDDDYPEGRADE